MTDFIFAGSLFFVSAAGAIAAFASVNSHAMGKRRQQHISAGRLAAEHATAMDALCKDDRAPSIIKSAVVDLSEIYDDEAIMGAVAHHFIRGKLSGPGGISQELTEAMHLLSYKHPDLWSHFVTAFRTGMMAAFLRWPSTAALADDLALTLAGKSEERELAAFTQRVYETPSVDYRGQFATV